MAEQPTSSGADLARQALAAARAAAKTAPAAGPKQRRPKTGRRNGSGRDPVGLGAALERIATEQGWGTGLAGGNILDQWATLCPQYADTVTPTAYDPERGRLDLRPANYAVASGLRLLGGQLAKQINDKMGRTVVRTIRVLPVGNTSSSTSSPDTAPRDAAGTAPVRTREAASPGYRQTLNAHLAAKPETAAASEYVQAARARQEAALAEPEFREPAQHFTDGLAELERIAAAVPDRTEAARRAALARKRADAAGSTLPRRAFD
jgi:hypothetical protein